MLFCFSLKAQEPKVSKTPFQFNQFFQSYALFNPASAGHEAELELYAAYSGYTGIRKTIYNLFTTLNYRIAENENRKHILGVNLFGDVEGKYLSRTRVHLNYAYHLNLNEQYTLSAGASLGFYNSTIKVNQFTGGGSDIAPDGNVGLWFYNHSFAIGVAYGQIFNSTVQPIIEITELTPYWNLNAYKTIQIDQNWRARGDMLIKLAKNFSTQINLSAQANYINRFSAGTNYIVGESVVVYAGLDSYEIKNQSLSLLFSYNIPLSENTINNSNKYEISISYFIDKDRGLQ